MRVSSVTREALFSLEVCAQMLNQIFFLVSQTLLKRRIKILAYNSLQFKHNCLFGPVASARIAVSRELTNDVRPFQIASGFCNLKMPELKRVIQVEHMTISTGSVLR